MGGIDSKESNPSEFLLRYSKVRTEFNPKYGEADIYKDINSNTYILYKEKWIDSQTDSQKFHQTLKSYKQVDNKNLSRL